MNLHYKTAFGNSKARHDSTGNDIQTYCVFDKSRRFLIIESLNLEHRILTRKFIGGYEVFTDLHTVAKRIASGFALKQMCIAHWNESHFGPIKKLQPPHIRIYSILSQ